MPDNYEEEDEQADPSSQLESSNRPQRNCRSPTKLEDYVVSNNNDLFDEEIINFALFADCELVNFDEASNDENWRKARDEEICAIKKNDTRELSELPTNKKPIGVKWVYKTKYKPNSEIDGFKARSVNKKKESIDYFEVFALVASLDTIHMIISLSAQKK